ncbi:MAG: hypothetical protein ACHQ7N_14515 [Candidatus Methylomirabilales bacterium]
MPAEFIDPRSQSKPPSRPPAPLLTATAGDLDDLHRLCWEGRVYEVESWIEAGRPLQVPADSRPRGRRLPTALQIALETGQYSLAVLLLSNGYNLDLEDGSPFNVALKARRWDLVDLLWTWGADPKRVDPSTLFDTYNSALFERFYAAGADLFHDHELADALGNHTSNRPLFGFAKRHRATDPRIQMELNIALAQYVEEENVKGVHLCLWAGADPHAPAPDLQSTGFLGAPEDDTEEGDRFIGWSAVERAVMFGKREVLPALKLDPARDNFDELYRSARDAHMVDALAAITPPSNVGSIVQSQCRYLDSRWPFGGHYPIAVLEEVFKTGARWTDTTPDEIAYIRRDLLKANDRDFVEMVKLLSHDAYCAATVLQELGRTPSFRKRLVQTGLMPCSYPDGSALNSHRVPGYRDVLQKFGIPIPKPRATRLDPK